MKLSQFIKTNLDSIVADWEDFARTLPAGKSMTRLALRDHSREILLSIAAEMEQPKSDQERSAQAEDITAAAQSAGTAAGEHGALRQMAGFDLVQLFAEFRALRASVLQSWKRSDEASATHDPLDQMMLFNEGMDKALAESVQRYSSEVAASRDMFLAVLGHDLRGPLSGISMATVLLSKPGLDEAARHKAAARIKRASTEMGGLITDLLEYTRTRLGAGMPMELAHIDLGTVCEDALESIRTGFPEQQFVQTLSGDLNLRADASRLRQALSNLLGNAVQHGDRGAPITLSAAGEADDVVVTVGNQGEPIAEAARLAIFEPLVRAPSAAAQSQERSKTSLGLGLFIVREIALGHGGTIEVQSTAETGTVFTMRLPRRARDAQPQRPPERGAIPQRTESVMKSNSTPAIKRATKAGPGKGPAAVGKGALAPGAGTALKGVDLPLPHERDESAHSVSATPDPVMVQAHRDIEAGLVDTDMRATAGMDAQRRAELVPGAGGKPPGKAR